MTLSAPLAPPCKKVIRTEICKNNFPSLSFLHAGIVAVRGTAILYATSCLDVVKVGNPGPTGPFLRQCILMIWASRPPYSDRSFFVYSVVLLRASLRYCTSIVIIFLSQCVS